LIFERTEGRLRSCCCGLIETQDARSAHQNLTKSDRKVAFFHRTVVEFLELHDNWSKLQSVTADSKFNVEVALISSALAEFKVAPLGDRSFEFGVHGPSLWRLLRMLSYEEKLSDSARQNFHAHYFPEFKRVIQHHWHDTSLFATPDEELDAVNNSIGRAVTSMKLAYPKTFILSCLIRTPVDNPFVGSFTHAQILCYACAYGYALC